jgi:hypothetical protein
MEDARIGESSQVPANGLVGDAEHVRKLARADRALAADDLGDLPLTLEGEVPAAPAARHLPPTS